MRGIRRCDWISASSALIMDISMQLTDRKAFSMTETTRKPPFTFAEIVVGAPWVARFKDTAQDHDKGILLHRNRRADEWGALGDELLALEREAREGRAAALCRLFARIAHWFSTLARSRRHA
jgi:hypothetical protein